MRAGIVGRPHGLDGSFYVARAQPRLLAPGSVLTIGGVTTTVVRRAGSDSRPIVRVAICGQRSDAEALRGEELTAAAALPTEREPGEYLAEELEGARVVDGEHQLGVVVSLLALPSCECLAVARTDGGELLVPLVRDAIRSVDVAARVIEVDRRFLGEAETVA